MYKVGNTIEVVYQARNVHSGGIALMEVYDETHTLDLVQSNTIGMTEIGTTGRYYDSFVPNAEGTWVVVLYEKIGAQKKGHAVKAHIVGSEDINSVGSKVDLVKAKTDNLPIDPADQSQVESAITTSENNIRGTDADTLKTLSDQMDAIESPAMVG